MQQSKFIGQCHRSSNVIRLCTSSSVKGSRGCFGFEDTMLGYVLTVVAVPGTLSDVGGLVDSTPRVSDAMI